MRVGNASSPSREAPLRGSRLPYSANFDPPHLGLGPDPTPAREIPARSYRKTMPGWMPTAKSSAGILRTETILEMDGLALFEADAHFIKLATQPHQLTYLESNGSEIKKIRYYPDLIAKRRDGKLIVVDFKIDVDANSSRWAKKSAVIETIYKAADIKFVTLPESVVRREPRCSNVKLLLRHRPYGKEVDKEAEVAIWRAIGERPTQTATLGDVIGANGLDLHSRADDPLLATFAQLVLKGHLAIDLNAPISAETKIFLKIPSISNNLAFNR